jgi:hypothetical protein
VQRRPRLGCPQRTAVGVRTCRRSSRQQRRQEGRSSRSRGRGSGFEAGSSRFGSATKQLRIACEGQEVLGRPPCPSVSAVRRRTCESLLQKPADDPAVNKGVKKGVQAGLAVAEADLKQVLESFLPPLDDKSLVQRRPRLGCPQRTAVGVRTEILSCFVAETCRRSSRQQRRQEGRSSRSRGRGSGFS